MLKGRLCVGGEAGEGGSRLHPEGGGGAGASPDTFPKLWSVTVLAASLCNIKQPRQLSCPQLCECVWLLCG